MKKIKDRFEFLTGDINWLEYGGKWILTEELPEGGRLGVELINWLNATGEKSGGKEHTLALSYIPNPDSVGEEKLESAMDCCGLEDSNLMAKYMALWDYGLAVGIESTNHNFKTEAGALKVVNDMFEQADGADVGTILDRPVNRVGQTGHELLKGDFQSALDRGMAALKERETHGEEPAVAVRQVSQHHLSAECWDVQFWGTNRCLGCNLHGKRDCGGQKIRATGKNEKGIPVGPEGLRPHADFEANHE